MASGGLRSLYLWVRKAVDWDIRENAKPASILVALTPLVPLLIIKPSAEDARIVAWFVGGILSAGWVIFFAWRCWRVLKAASLRGDRHFDRIGKLGQPPEYHASESATKARRRRKRQDRNR